MSSYEPDPQRYFGGAEETRNDERKLRQLCRQAERAAAAALAECADEALADAVVCDVSPAPDARRLAVTVEVPDGTDVEALRDALRRAGPLVRAHVASEIHRKRTPEVVFEVRLAEEFGRG